MKATKEFFSQNGMGSNMVDIFEIGAALQEAGRLDRQPLYVLGANVIPDSCVPLTSIDRCIAKVMFLLAGHPEAPAVYLSADQAEKGCGGGMQWSGFCEANPMIKFFVSTGTPEFRNGMAEYLRASPEIAEEAAERAGGFTAPGENLVIATADKVANLGLDASAALCVTCFGTAEQIRNLSALVHYRNTDIFQNVVLAVGPACSTFVSYPAGLAQKSPKNAAYAGPADPTGNIWFPPDFMALGIPIALAQQMADDVPASFLTQRPMVAFPTKRAELKYEPEE
jgi:hypothetical protein